MQTDSSTVSSPNFKNAETGSDGERGSLEVSFYTGNTGWASDYQQRLGCGWDHLPQHLPNREAKAQDSDFQSQEDFDSRRFGRQTDQKPPSRWL